MNSTKRITIGLSALILTVILMAAYTESPLHGRGHHSGQQLKTEESHVFYVSTQGDDSWSGTLETPAGNRKDGPFASLAGARDAIRKHRKAGTLQAPVKVYVKEGTYRPSETLVFRPEDSGTEKAPVSYQSAPDETAIISGGEVLSGFTEEEEGLWKLEIPEVKNGSWEFRQLFAGDKRLARSRIPAEGWYYLEPVSEDPEGNLAEQTSFRVSEGHIEAYDKIHQAELVVLNRWNNSRLFIESIDEANQICHFKGEIFRGPKKGKRFFFENLREGLTRPGTWYLDYEEGMLYLRMDENPDNAEITAPVLERIVEFRGKPSSGRFVSHITLKDLAFRHATFPVPEEGIRARQAASYLNAAIYAESARYITLEHCDIGAVGQYGVDFNSRCHHNRIIHNKFMDIGAGGIRLGTTERRMTDELVSCHNVITDNFIADGGQTAFGCIGIFAANCRYTTISHNEVTRMKYTGISIGWDWGWAPNFCRENVIEKNYIHHVGMETLSDMGGIYTLGVSPGTYIRGNLIHDVWPYHDSGRGIYLDQGSTGYIVENNIVYNTLSASIRLQRGTSGNFILNNVFALSKNWIMGYDTDRFNLFEKNLVYWKEGTLFKRNRIYNFNTVIDYNVYWNPDNPNPEFAGYDFEEWQKQRRPKDFFVTFPAMDRNSFYADPKFNDPENGDFTLAPDSPAFELGFEPIDMSDVGPRPYKKN